MANGFFLGGVAEGADAARGRTLEENRLQADVGLRTRGLDLQERQVARNESNDLITRADKQVADTMAIVAETVKQGLAVGRDPATIKAAVAPLVQSAQQISARIGGNPASLDAQVDTMLTGPTGTEAATAAGRAAGVTEGEKQITAQRTITGGAGDSGGFIVDPAKRAEAEEKLADNYRQESKDFITLRNFKDRIDIAPKTGAGDIALVFSYMKVLDPASTVREGEYATAANSGGVAANIVNLYNKLLDGQSLGDPARANIKDAAEKIWTKAAERQNALVNKYSGIAQRRGLTVNNIIVDRDVGPSSGVSTTPGGTTFRVLP